ncbi:MAG: glycosyltransferase family A protein, partial [Erysipelotrichaceae bacterium]
MELISVIVPVYNVEKYIDRCVSSILNQTYKNLDIILVDDGSQDKSGQICDEYALKDNRIKVLHKSNGGLSDARNKGIELSKGEYISFVDSDDTISNNFIDKLYNLCVNYSSDISMCYFKQFTSEISFNREHESRIDIFTNIQMLENLINEKYVQSTVAWNKLYKAE